MAGLLSGYVAEPRCNLAQMKTDGFIEVRARAVSVVLSLTGVTLFVLAGLWVAFGLDILITSQLTPLQIHLRKRLPLKLGLG